MLAAEAVGSGRGCTRSLPTNRFGQSGVRHCQACWLQTQSKEWHNYLLGQKMNSCRGVSSSAGEAEPCQSAPPGCLQELCPAALGGPRCYVSAPNPSCGQKFPPGSSHAGENGSSTLARPPAAVEKPMDSWPDKTAELIQINPNCGG